MKPSWVMIMSLVAGWLPFAAQANAAVDEATARRTRALIMAMRMATLPIHDLSCTLEIRGSGGQGREYVENRIRMYEVYKKRGSVTDARADQEIAQLKSSLESLETPERELEVMYWQTRWDGLFHVTRISTYEDGSKHINKLSFDGELPLAYNRDAKQVLILKEPGGVEHWPDFGWRVGYERLEQFLTRALREGDVRISDETGPGNQKLVKITAITPTVPELPHQQMPVFARIWLDPGRNFLPLRTERGYPIGRKASDWPVSSITIIQGKQILPGVWYPVASISRGATWGNLVDADQPPEKWKVVAFPNTWVTKCRMRDIRVNQGLKKQAFYVRFPEDVKVIDTRWFKSPEDRVR